MNTIFLFCRPCHRFVELVFVWLVGAVFAAAHAANGTATTAHEWIAQADGATRAADWGGAQNALTHALAVSIQSGDEAAQAIVRQKLGGVLVTLGDRESALGQFEANRRYYKLRGDTASYSNAALHGTEILIDLERFEDALRLIAEYSLEVDGDMTRRAVMARFQAVAYERAGQTDRARRAVLESGKVISPDAWNRYLREDAIRLGVWEPTARPRWLLWTGVGLLVVLVGFAVVWRARRTEFALLCIVCVGTLALSEWALRVAMPSPAGVRHILHPPNHSTKFHPEPGVMPGIDYRESHFTTNSIGLRGSEMPGAGVVRVLAVGGSSTEALFLDDEDAWTAVMERDLREHYGLRVWGGNAGKSGLTTFSHITQVRAYAEEIRPSLIIIQSGFNDMSLCISGGRQEVRDNALRFRWPDHQDAYGLFVFQEIRPPQATGTLRIEDLIERAFARLTMPAHDASISQHTYVVQDHAGLFYKEQRRRRNVAKMLDTVPEVRDCIAAFQENLRRLVRIASTHGARLILLTQGSLYRSNLSPKDEQLLWFGSVDESFFGAVPPSRYYSTAVMADVLQQYNSATLQVCEELKLTCVDVNHFLPQTSAMYYDDAHVNIQGSRILGRELARRLVKEHVFE